MGLSDRGSMGQGSDANGRSLSTQPIHPSKYPVDYATHTADGTLEWRIERHKDVRDRMDAACRPEDGDIIFYAAGNAANTTARTRATGSTQRRSGCSRTRRVAQLNGRS